MRHKQVFVNTTNLFFFLKSKGVKYTPLTPHPWFSGFSGLSEGVRDVSYLYIIMLFGGVRVEKQKWYVTKCHLVILESLGK